MRQPLWTINSALLALFFLCFYILFLLQPKTPKVIALEPEQEFEVQSISVAPINLKNIYEADLFKTHITNNHVTQPTNPTIDIPFPPAYQEFESSNTNGTIFLDPLPITITGIMTFGNEDTNRAIIRDNRSQEEHSYQVGDDLEDAQIIRILSNKVIIVRANSQQETLFLREQDIIADLDMIEPYWDDLVQITNEGKYQLKANELAAQIKSLGKLIEILNLITAYKDGKSIGIKVGSDTTGNLVNKLGLHSGDVILNINDIALDTVTGRIAAYNLAISPDTQELKIQLSRENKIIDLQYILIANEQAPDDNNIAHIKQHVETSSAKFTNTQDKIKNKDRENIAQFKNKISQSVSG